jgi:hypothetical protein
MKSVATRIILCALWFLVAGIGSAVLLKQENTPGKASTTPQTWPAGAAIERSIDRPTLLMFAHPQCPCTRASIKELNRLLARCASRPAVEIIFLQHPGASEDWMRGFSWTQATALPGVRVSADLGGQEAHRFGAETSGFVVVYDSHGRLLYRGGLTSARGHEGDNAGADAIIAQLGGDVKALKETRVFGCSLFDGCEAVTD